LRPDKRIRVKREPHRGRYDRETIDAILDEALICHLGFEVDGQPYVIPTLHARVGDKVYVHGSAASRMLRHLASDVRRVFDRVVEHLLPGGVAVFELRDGRNLDERPLSEERDGLRVTTRWQKRCGARGSDLYLVSAYEPSSGLDFLEAHNLFLLRPSLFVEQARRAGFAEISLFAGYTSEPYRVEVGTDVAVLVARSPRSERAEHR